MRRILLALLVATTAQAAEKKKPACLDTIEAHRGGEVDAGAGIFSDGEKVDATRLAAGERKRLGKLMPEAAKLAPREILRRAVATGQVQTFWHVEATLCLESERQEGDRQLLDVSGTHLYFTNKRNEGHYQFRLEVDKEGVVSLVGR